MEIGRIEMDRGREIAAAVEFTRAWGVYHQANSPSEGHMKQAIVQRTHALRRAMRSQKGEVVYARLARFHHAAGESDWEMSARLSRAALLEDEGRWLEAAREWLRIATYYWDIHDYPSAAVMYTKQAHALKHAGDAIEQTVRALRKAALTFQEAKQTNKAVEIYLSIREELDEAGHWNILVRVLFELEKIYHNLNQFQEARQTRDDRALILEKAGRLDGALRLWEAIAADEKEREDTFSLAKTYLVMGRLFRRLGRPKEAGQVYYAAAHYFFHHHNNEEAVGVLGLSSLVYREGGMLKKANRVWERARRKATLLVPNSAPAVTVYSLMGQLLEGMKEYDLASEMFSRAVRKALKANHPELVFVCEKLGDVAAGAGQLKRARQAYQHALSLYQAGRDDEGVARVRHYLTEIGALH